MTEAAIDRAKTLLKAARQIILQSDQALFETVHYDDVECDGGCVTDDIKYWFESEFGEELEE